MTTLTYDPLSRVLTKTVTGAGLSPETTRNAYDEVRAGFFNLGKLVSATSGVTADWLVSGRRQVEAAVPSRSGSAQAVV